MIVELWPLFRVTIYRLSFLGLPDSWTIAHNYRPYVLVRRSRLANVDRRPSEAKETQTSLRDLMVGHSGKATWDLKRSHKEDSAL